MYFGPWQWLVWFCSLHNNPWTLLHHPLRINENILWDVISHPCLNLNGGLATQYFKLAWLSKYFLTPQYRICASVNWVIGGNVFSPARDQTITWTNAGLLSIGTMETSFSEIWIEILSFSLNKMHLQMSSAKWWPFSRPESFNSLRPSDAYMRR